MVPKTPLPKSESLQTERMARSQYSAQTGLAHSVSRDDQIHFTDRGYFVPFDLFDDILCFFILNGVGMRS